MGFFNAEIDSKEIERSQEKNSKLRAEIWDKLFRQFDGPNMPKIKIFIPKI